MILKINGFVPIAPCVSRRSWLGADLLSLTARGKYLQEQSRLRWERNYPENAEYARQPIMECEVGFSEGFRLIIDSTLSAHEPQFKGEEYIVILHPDWVGPIL